jgi:hypothetical protein
VGLAVNWEKLLSRQVRTNGGELRAEINTLRNALAMIDEDLIEKVRHRPHWVEARNCLFQAAETGLQADIYHACEHTSERSVRMTLNLAFVAPDIAEVAIEGRLPYGTGLVQLTELSPEWASQWPRVLQSREL